MTGMTGISMIRKAVTINSNSLCPIGPCGSSSGKMRKATTTQQHDWQQCQRPQRLSGSAIHRRHPTPIYGLPPIARNQIDSCGCSELRAVVYPASEVGS